MIKRFREVHTASAQTKSLREVVSEITKKNGWSASDEETLANSSPDDYYKLFKSETGEHLSRYVNACLQFGRFSNATERQKRIGEAATVALKRIGQESIINRWRVQKYGIQLDADSDAETTTAHNKLLQSDDSPAARRG